MKKISFFIIVALLFSCKPNSKSTSSNQSNKDPLPSFNEGIVKNSIIDFVHSICDSTSKKYIAKEERIAVFDNDGTLWVEQPLPSQIYFAAYRIQKLAKSGEYKWEKQEPFKSVIEKDSTKLQNITKENILQIVGKAHALSNVEDFSPEVNEWLQSQKHPVLDKKFTDLVYQPMLELLDFLNANHFKTYIVSGGSLEFMRVWAPNVYNIDISNIIGSRFKTETKQENNQITISQTESFEFMDDHEGKIIAINEFIGKKPVMIVGNSDGDLEMMEYATTNNPNPTFMLLLNHTDGEREFLYNDKMLSGTLKKGLEIAKKNNWTIIDMKKDWNTVFPN